jgi:serine phosphatase RsbU (regulator of sigma subunit)
MGPGAAPLSALKAQWRAAFRPLPGQQELGDACWIREGEGFLDLAVIDGLGHGGEAAAASRAALACLQRQAELAGQSGLSLPEALQACHGAMRGTRGAALSMASLDLKGARMQWLGVGNVEGLLLSGERRGRLLSKSGIVGFNLPHPHLSGLPLESGDILFFCSDGIDSAFADKLDRRLGPLDLAGQILRDCAKDNDDALALVVHLS